LREIRSNSGWSRNGFSDQSPAVSMTYTTDTMAS
jgi:hypothetical protein